MFKQISNYRGCCSKNGGIAICDKETGRIICNNGKYSDCKCLEFNEEIIIEEGIREPLINPVPVPLLIGLAIIYLASQFVIFRLAQKDCQKKYKTDKSKNS